MDDVTCVLGVVSIGSFYKEEDSSTTSKNINITIFLFFYLFSNICIYR